MKTLELFLDENNVLPENMQLLGSGENGTAWRCDDMVIKQTSSKWEHEFALKQTNGYYPFFAQIHAVAKNDDYYFYIAEYLQKDEDIEIYLNMIEHFLSTQDLGILQIRKFDLVSFNQKYKKGMSAGCQRFFHQMCMIVDDYISIGANDIHHGNLGYDAIGNLKAFDIDINQESKDEITVW